MNRKGIFDWMNKARVRMVLILAGASLGLALLFAEVPVKSKLFLPIVSVLPSFYFWLIRNKDKLEGLEQSRESNEQHNFSSAMQLFTEKENMEANAIGLQLLVRIKNQGSFEQEIDIATHGKNLQGANLLEADLEGANLQGADLLGANLRWANLQKAFLVGVNLEGANLLKADLEEADLRWANLQGANLKGAKLQKADLEGAVLKGTNLIEAKLQGACLLGADLRGVRNWEKASWYGANLTDIQCSDEETRAGIERLAKEKPGN